MTNQQPKQQPLPRQVFPLDSTGILMSDSNKCIVQMEATASVDAAENQSATEYGDGKAYSAKLNKMSMEERTQGIHELHGVADDVNNIEETPEMLESKMDEVTQIASSFAESDSLAFRRALELNKKYVQEIQRLCLRADYYDSHKAAARMVSYFSYKKELFGGDEQLLARHVTFADVGDEAQDVLNRGLVQLLPERDRAGRAIIMGVTRNLNKFRMESCLRAFYYVFMNALKQEETQKRGVVLVIYALGQEKFQSNRPANFARSWWFQPMRTVAVHLCYDTKIVDVASKGLFEGMESYYLCRFRSHFGSHLDCAYSLASFGIPSSVWPINPNTGEMDIRRHTEWLETLKNREEQDPLFSHKKKTSLPPVTSKSENVSVLHVPGPLDIVMGRGRHPKTSIGYQRLRKLLDIRFDEYNDAKKFDKVYVVDDIIRALRASGCRFIKSSQNDGWCEESDHAIREKVSHTFRNLRMAKRRTKVQY